MKRLLICADALAWLSAEPDLSGCSFVTSLPDVSEIGLDLESWKIWFRQAAEAILRACPERGAAIFYQTDIKRDGVWIDKSQLILEAAGAAGSALLWRKVVCRRPPGSASFGRPGFAHLLCFSRELRADPARSEVDVLADGGKATWARGMGEEVCWLACRWLLRNSSTHTVVDPFCGEGLVLAVANRMGLHALGVDLSPKRCRKAAALDFPERPRREPPDPPS